MWNRRTALPILLALLLAPAAAQAQERTASAGGFGGLSLNSYPLASLAQLDFGINAGTELTPNIQAIGEFGRIGNMLPPLMAGLMLLTPYDLRVSAYYGEGGVRLLGAPGSGVNPYAEATAGIARLSPQISGFGSGWDAMAAVGLNAISSTEPMFGVGGGVLLRSGPVVADIGYRYKQVGGSDSLGGLLSAGQPLRAHQVRFGFGVRF